jgi:hypothetical protein
MTVRMILPGAEMRSLHAGRRVTTFLYLTSMNRLKKAALRTSEVNCNGIIPLTLTA